MKTYLVMSECVSMQKRQNDHVRRKTVGSFPRLSHGFIKSVGNLWEITHYFTTDIIVFFTFLIQLRVDAYTRPYTYIENIYTYNECYKQTCGTYTCTYPHIYYGLLNVKVLSKLTHTRVHIYMYTMVCSTLRFCLNLHIPVRYSNKHLR